MSDVFYPVIVDELDESDGGGFVAYVFDLPGCMSDGDTPADAIENARQAALEWIDEAERLGRPVPAQHSAADHVQEMRTRTMETAEKQNALIRAQRDLQEAQGREINELREELGRLQESRQLETGLLVGWGSSVRGRPHPARLPRVVKDQVPH